MTKPLLLLVVACLVSCTPPTTSSSDDQAAIKALLASGTRALASHDWAEYSQFWANDADIEVIHPASAVWIVGWDSVAAKYRQVIGDTGTHISAENRRQRIHVSPSRDMAWVTQEDLLQVGPPGKQVPVVQWSTSVYEKRSGQWRLVHAHASIPSRRP